MREGVRLGVVARPEEELREGLSPREEPRDEEREGEADRLLPREELRPALLREDPREEERPTEEPREELRELEARPEEPRELERCGLEARERDERCGLLKERELRLGVEARERDGVALERPAELRPRWANASVSTRTSRLMTARTANRNRERFMVGNPRSGRVRTPQPSKIDAERATWAVVPESGLAGPSGGISGALPLFAVRFRRPVSSRGVSRGVPARGRSRGFRRPGPGRTARASRSNEQLIRHLIVASPPQEEHRDG